MCMVEHKILPVIYRTANGVDMFYNLEALKTAVSGITHNTQTHRIRKVSMQKVQTLKMLLWSFAIKL